MANELYPGSQAVLYVQEELAYDQTAKLTGGNAMFTISETFTGGQEREPRPDRSGSADHLERYVGRKTAEFEITKLILPNGNVTTEPDDRLLWKNLFGHVSLGTTSIEYLFATAHLTSLTLRRGIRTGGSAGVAELQEHMRGAVVSRGEISWGAAGNNGLAQVRFSGQAREWGYTGNTSIGTGYVSIGTGAGSFRVTAPRQLTKGSVVAVVSSILDTGGGSGILIDTINYTTGVISFSETLGASASSGRVVKPYNPTAHTSGSPIHGRLGTLSLDGSASSIKHLGGSITIEDNRSLLNEEVGEDAASRVLRTDRRNVTFSLDFIIDKDSTGKLLGDMLLDTSQNMHVTIGSLANKKMRFIMRNAHFDFTSLDVPDQDMVRISMTGRALGTNGNDSLKMRIL